MSTLSQRSPAQALARALAARAAGERAEVCARIAAAHAEAWQSRLEPSAYRCERVGETWVAEGPCGQRFEFNKMPGGRIACLSQSGESYVLGRNNENGFACSCPAAANSGSCKHGAALIQVCRTNAGARQ